MTVSLSSFSHPALVGILALCAAPCVLSAGEAEPAPEGQRFVRFSEDEERGKLETSVTRYTHADGSVVDLVGAVHLADAGYYDALNKIFTDYETVLYELVGGGEGVDPAAPPEGAAAQDPAANLLRGAQMMITNLLKLEHQVQGIDYKARNFVHADLSWEKFRALQNEKGENFITLLQRAMEAEGEIEGAKGGGGEDLGMLLSLVAGLRTGDPSGLKLLMARQFVNAEELIGAFEGEEGSVIIAERNKVVMEKLAEQRQAGRKKVAVFYGAGHFPDMEKRLLEAGFKRGPARWMTAWDIAKPKNEGEEGDDAEKEAA